MPPHVEFGQNQDRIPSVHREEVEAGIRDALADRPDTEQWEIADIAPPDRDLYIFNLRVNNKKVGQLKVSPTALHSGARGVREELRVIVEAYLKQQLPKRTK